MQFKWHLLTGFILSYILVYFFNFSIIAGSTIFLSSWLIDIDHYFWYGFETKDWNPFHGISWHNKFVPKWKKINSKEKDKFKRGIYIFHEFIFWAILAILSFFYTIFFWILIGIMIHMTLDFIELIKNKESLYNKIFLYYVIRRNKNKKSLMIFRKLKAQNY